MLKFAFICAAAASLSDLDLSIHECMNMAEEGEEEVATSTYIYRVRIVAEPYYLFGDPLGSLIEDSCGLSISKSLLLFWQVFKETTTFPQLHGSWKKRRGTAFSSS
jgi:hypothetical protein